MQETMAAPIMNKQVTLKDDQVVLIRDMKAADVDRSHEFFAGLPAEDRKYLRRDVTRRDVIERRIEIMDRGRVRRLVALSDKEIVADGSLDLEGHGWGDDVAEIRLIVARPFQRLGLGRQLARELFLLAAQNRVERIMVRMLAPQESALCIFRKLGFHDEFLIPQHVRDREGNLQDMIIMRCNLEDLWHEMENLVEFSDFPRNW
jgi:ribosomal protein S18 acetylase RimI-like enzyme